MKDINVIQWKRGFIRLWVLIAIVWVAGISTISRPWEAMEEYTEAKERLEKIPGAYARIDADIAKGGGTFEGGKFADVAQLTRIREKVEERQLELETKIENFPTRTFNFVLLLFGAPMVLLGLGAAVTWVLVGFRRSTNTQN